MSDAGDELQGLAEYLRCEARQVEREYGKPDASSRCLRKWAGAVESLAQQPALIRRKWAGAVEPLAQQPVSSRRICCAANRCKKRGIVLGPRHWHPAMHAPAFNLLGPNYQRHVWEQGFIDFDGVFLNRTEAWKVAEAAGQIVARCGGDDANGGTLYSENLG